MTVRDVAALSHIHLYVKTISSELNLIGVYCVLGYKLDYSLAVGLNGYGT